MATVDQVLRAVEKLTATYEGMNDKLNESLVSKVPLPYKNGRCDWDGVTDFTVDSEAYLNVTCKGSATKARYGSWNNFYMMTLTQSVNNTNPKTNVPVHYHIIRTKKNSDEEKKTFFVRFSNSDNWGYGYHSAWLVDEGGNITKYLGTRDCDKYTGEGRSTCFDMFNRNAQAYRYNQWIGFNFNLSEAYVDDDDYIYIALSGSVNTYYIAGVGIADRNFDFEYTDSHSMVGGYVPYNTTANNGCVNGGMSNQLNYGYYGRNTEYLGVEFPYPEEAKQKGLLLCFSTIPDYIYNSNAIFKGSMTGTVFSEDGISCGKYGRVFRQAFNIGGNQFVCYKIPAFEVTENTVVYNGKSFIKVDIPKFFGERGFYLTCIWAECMED